MAHWDTISHIVLIVKPNVMQNKEDPAHDRDDGKPDRQSRGPGSCPYPPAIQRMRIRTCSGTAISSTGESSRPARPNQHLSAQVAASGGT